MNQQQAAPGVSACACGVEEGQLHELGCRFELCPFCGVSASASCRCIYDHLGLRRRIHPARSSYLSEEVYSEGLSEEQQAEWDRRCAARGRLPYVYAPQTCGRCGTLWPEFFTVQDEAWEYYAGPELRDRIVCEPCFTALRHNIDKHQPRPDWVPSADDIVAYSAAWRTGNRPTTEPAHGSAGKIRFP
jgi:hypothetical protein